MRVVGRMSPCHTYSYPSHLIVPQILAAEILTVLHLGCLLSIIYLPSTLKALRHRLLQSIDIFSLGCCGFEGRSISII